MTDCVVTAKNASAHRYVRMAEIDTSAEIAVVQPIVYTVEKENAVGSAIGFINFPNARRQCANFMHVIILKRYL